MVLAWLASLAFFGLFIGCGRAPSPLYPALEGSIGMPHRGVLTSALRVPDTGPGYHFLRENGRHFALPRFASAVVRAAARVDEESPGSTLVIGDLSLSTGGRILPHLSHRSGRDADLVLYATTLEGAPVLRHGFVHYGPDGLGYDAVAKRYLRFDVAREWILIKTLLEDPEARIQWIFIHHDVRTRLLEWALASGEPLDVFERAFQVMAEPHPGGLHDDHTHVRTACTEEEVFRGCEPFGPVRPWLTPKPTTSPPSPERVVPSGGSTLDADIIAELMHPLESKQEQHASAAISSPARAPRP